MLDFYLLTYNDLKKIGEKLATFFTYDVYNCRWNDSTKALLGQNTKFYILGGDFFSFWRNFKNEDSRAKKRFSDFAYKTRVFSPGAPKNIFFQKKTLQASYTHLLRWFRTIFNLGYGGGRVGPPSPHNVVKIARPTRG